MVDEYATIAIGSQALVCDNRLCDIGSHAVQERMDRDLILAFMARHDLNNRQLGLLIKVDEDKVSKSLKDPEKGKPRKWQGDEVMRLMKLIDNEDGGPLIKTEVRAAGIVDPLEEKFGDRPLAPLPLVGSGIGGEWDDLDDKIEMMELQLGEVLDYVRRPLSLRDDKNAYALTVLGESMHPRFKPGKRIIVSPRSPIAIGDDVVVQLCGDPDADGQMRVVRVLIKELVRRGGESLTLRQYNPPAEFVVPLSRVAQTHKVIGEVF